MVEESIKVVAVAIGVLIRAPEFVKAEKVSSLDENTTLDRRSVPGAKPFIESLGDCLI